MDLRDLAEFASADTFPIEAAAGFKSALHERMRGLVRRLYQS